MNRVHLAKVMLLVFLSLFIVSCNLNSDLSDLYLSLDYQPAYATQNQIVIRSNFHYEVNWDLGS